MATTTNATAPAKDRITCHILDTTAGKPARGVRVRLELTPPSAACFAPPTASSSASAGATSSSPSPAVAQHHGQHGATARTFESQTDDDGRVKAWLPFSASNDSGEVPIYTLDDVLGEVEATTAATGAGAGTGSSRWTLRFDTAGYFGSAGTFFPEVAVVFEVQRGQQYHVPLLLSPYGYTTYRGS